MEALDGSGLVGLKDHVAHAVQRRAFLASDAMTRRVDGLVVRCGDTRPECQAVRYRIEHLSDNGMVRHIVQRCP